MKEFYFYENLDDDSVGDPDQFYDVFELNCDFELLFILGSAIYTYLSGYLPITRLQPDIRLQPDLLRFGAKFHIWSSVHLSS